MRALHWTAWTAACTLAGSFVASQLPANVGFAFLVALGAWAGWAAWQSARRDIAAAHVDEPIRLRVCALRIPPATDDLRRS